MVSIFLYGTLRHPPLLRLMAGGDLPETRPARLSGHTVVWAAGESFPLIVARDGMACDGEVVEASPELKARMDYYEGAFGYALAPVTVETEAGPIDAEVYLPPDTGLSEGGPWQLEDWAERWGDLSVEAAKEVMALSAARPAEVAGARFRAILTRAQARINARQSAPTTLRRKARPHDIEIRAMTQPYASFFAVEDYVLRHVRFDGSTSDMLERAAFVSGDAVVVLPYDPARDRVLLVEQFRTGPFARGDAEPWTLEAIAGRVDGGETPAACAQREAVEEAGLRLARLLEAPNHYPSPGAKTEYLYSYVGLCDLPEEGGGSGGLETEHEDIRTHVIGFGRLMELIESGEVNNGPLILLALWLAGQRSGLRAEAGATDG